MGKVYAVKKGLKTGLFYDWPSCQASIKGYSGAIYSSFSTEEDAIRYLMGETVLKAKDISEVQPITKNDMCNVYTHGVYSTEDKTCGLVVEIETICGKKQYMCTVKDAFCDKQKGIAGEVLSAYLGLQIAIEQGFKYINVYNSYDGIQKWVHKEWMPKSRVVIDFVKYIDRHSEDAIIIMYQLKPVDKSIRNQVKYLSSFALTTHSRLSVEQIIDNNIGVELLEDAVNE